MIGNQVEATGKSKHAGYGGIVVADYGNMLLVKASDDKYVSAYKSLGREGKYFQVDSRWYKEIKDVSS